MSLTTLDAAAAPRVGRSAAPAPRPGRFRALVARFGVLDVLALVVALLLVVAVVAPGLLAPYDPLAGDDAYVLAPPSAAHWFGTDYLGRDLLSRVVHGTVRTLLGSAVAVAIGLGDRHRPRPRRRLPRWLGRRRHQPPGRRPAVHPRPAALDGRRRRARLRDAQRRDRGRHLLRRRVHPDHAVRGDDREGPAVRRGQPPPRRPPPARAGPAHLPQRVERRPVPHRAAVRPVDHLDLLAQLPRVRRPAAAARMGPARRRGPRVRRLLALAHRRPRCRDRHLRARDQPARPHPQGRSAA